MGDWAKSIGVQGSFNEVKNQGTGVQFSIAKKIVYTNVKKALGLD